jgi:hypothetical protein
MLQEGKDVIEDYQIDGESPFTYNLVYGNNTCWCHSAKCEVESGVMASKLGVPSSAGAYTPLNSYMQVVIYSKDE